MFDADVMGCALLRCAAARNAVPKLTQLAHAG